jgi:delta 1-pyrroline-5-carboxylate dehydrogenase
MKVDAVYLVTGKKIDSNKVAIVPEKGVFIRDGSLGYYLVPAQSVASVHFTGSKEEIDRIFNEELKA